MITPAKCCTLPRPPNSIPSAIHASRTEAAASGQRRRTATAPATSATPAAARGRSGIELPSQTCNWLSTSRTAATSQSTRSNSITRLRSLDPRALDMTQS